MTEVAVAEFLLHTPGPLGLRAFTESWRVSDNNFILRGGGSRRERILEYLSNRDDPLWRQIEPPRDHYIAISLSDAVGEVSIGIRVHDSEPPLDMEAWDRIEQAGAEFGYLPPLFIPAENHEQLNGLTEDVRAAIGDGWHMVRVSCLSMQWDIREQLVDQTRAQIDIWPIDGPTGHATIKQVPATPRQAEPAAPLMSLQEAWSALVRALRARGVTDNPAFHMQLDTGDYGSVSADPHLSGIEASGDISHWFASMQSLPQSRVAGLIPGFDLLRSEEAEAVRTVLLDAWAPGRVYPEPYPRDAGQPAYTYIPEYVPVAERDGTALVVDTRSGPARGGVWLFQKVDADDTTTHWASLADLLADIGDAISSGATLLGWRAITTPDGHLRWELA